MKKLMLMCVAMVVAAASFAQGAKPQRQGKGNPEMKAKKLTAWMKQELNLSADQEVKIYGVNLNSAKSMMAVKRDSTLSPEVKKQKHKELAKAAREQYKAILTPEQASLLKQKLKERRDAKRAKNGGNKPSQKVDLPTNTKNADFKLSDDEIEDIVD